MGRIYTEAEKASALSKLDENAGNLRQTSRDTDVPVGTLLRWRDGVGVNKDVQTERTDKNLELIDRYRENALKALTTAAEKYGQSSASELHSLAGDSVVKIERLTGAVSAQEAERERERFLDILTRHVTDPATLDKITTELDNPNSGENMANQA